MDDPRDERRRSNKFDKRWFTPNAVESPRRSDRVRTERGSSARARDRDRRACRSTGRRSIARAASSLKAVRGRDRRVK
jgi:hypothetical protein